MADDEKALKEKTRKTADLYFEGIPVEERAYNLWRFFDKDLAKEISMFYTGKLYAREKIPQDLPHPPSFISKIFQNKNLRKQGKKYWGNSCFRECCRSRKTPHHGGVAHLGGAANSRQKCWGTANHEV